MRSNFQPSLAKRFRRSLSAGVEWNDFLVCRGEADVASDCTIVYALSLSWVMLPLTEQHRICLSPRRNQPKRSGIAHIPAFHGREFLQLMLGLVNSEQSKIDTPLL